MNEAHDAMRIESEVRTPASLWTSHPPAAAVLALCAVILSLRRTGALSNPQLWGEDSYIFRDAYLYGWHAFTIPFAGYLHTILRVIGATAMAIDPATARWTFVLGAFVVTLYVASRALSQRSPLSSYYGLGALAVVLVPDTYEVFLNVVNLQWVVGAGLLLLLISSDPVSPRQWIHDVIAALAAGLTGPFSVFFLPLFCLRAWYRKSRSSACLAGVIGLCAVVQFVFMYEVPPLATAKTFSDVAVKLVLPAVGRRVAGSVLLGTLLYPDTDLYIGSIAGIATFLGVAFLAVVPGRYRLERSLLGVAFVVLLVGGLYRQRFVLDRFFIQGAGGRYFYIPQLILIWLLLFAAGQRGLTGRIAPVMLAGSLLLNLPRFRDPPYHDSHWSRYEPSIRQGKAVVVPINPTGWVMPLPDRKP
jgi:hypothetical protein